MASSTFIERSPDSDKTLILVMDEDYNLTGHPKHIDKMLANRQSQELRVVRLRASAANSDTDSGDEDGVPKVNLIVEELCPEDAGEEGRSGESSLPPDIVDPLSQLDNEQMLRLKKALASEQAKQMLGENVTAMLDMLSVEENTTAFLQQSIKFDHCYTNLSPSADPKGPSFHSLIDNGASTSASVLTLPSPVAKPRGRPPGPACSKSPSSVGVLKKGLSAPPTNQRTGGTDSDNDEIVDVDDGDYSDSSQDSDEDGDRDSDEDYTDRNTPRRGRGSVRGSGRRGRGGLRIRGGTRRRGRPPRVAEEEDVAPPQEVSSQDELLPKAPGKRGRPRKILPDPSPPSSVPTSSIKFITTTVKTPAATAIKIPPGSSPNPSAPTHAKSPTATSPSVVALDQTQVDSAAAKVLSGDAIRLGRPVGKTEEERRRDMARVIQSLEAGGRKVIFVHRKAAPKAGEVRKQQQSVLKGPEVTSQQPTVIDEEQPTVNKSPKQKTYERRDSGSIELEPTDGSKMMGNKYPRRENRKLPAHLADTALFSAPDVIKRLSAGEEVTLPPRIKPKPSQRSILSYVRKSNAAPVEESPPIVEETKLPAEAPETASQGQCEEVVTSVILPTSVDEVKTVLEEKEEKKEVGVEPPKEKPERVDKEKRRRDSDKGDKTTTAEVKADKTVRRRSKQDVEDVKVKAEKIEALDVMQMDATILQPLPAESMKQLIRSVVEDEDKEELKKETSNEEVNSEPNRPSKDGKLSSPDTSSPKDQAAASIQLADDKKRNASKRRRSEEASDFEEEEDPEDDAISEASWNSEDDPERLWCICRKPHDNRFMICCDLCQDWFHGQCVGISKALGKQMEADRLEWSCPKCSKKKKEDAREREASKEASNKLPPSKGGELRQTKLSNFPFKIPPPEASAPRKCIMCKGPVRENSVYCSDDCIRKHSHKAISKLTAKTQASAGAPTAATTPVKKERRIVVMDPSTKVIVNGQNAPTEGNLATWLQRNPSYHVLFKKPSAAVGGANTPALKVIQGTNVKKIPVAAKSDVKGGQTRLMVSPNSKQIKFVSDASGKASIQIVPAGPKKLVLLNKSGSVLKLSPDSPKSEQKPKDLAGKKADVDKQSGLKLPRKRKEKHQVLPDLKQTTITTPVKSEERSSEQPSSSSSGVKERKPKQQPQAKPVRTEDKGGVRESVKKTLGEALKARAQDCKDLEVTDDDIENLVGKIEERLFRHFDEKVDVKYKSKYRSLVFNIKDQKNQTLFRKILEKSISPKDLVKLSADELASQELAQWREKEQQHQLEMIKKTELELMAQGQTFIIKSHKGEDVIAKDLKVAAAVAEIDPNTPAQELVSALNSVSSTTPDNAEDEEKDKHRSSETSLMKMKKREKEKRREKERNRKSKDRERRRGRSRSRSRDGSSRRTSKSSRKRSRSRSSHRHRERERKEKNSRDSGMSQEKVGDETAELAEISTTDSLPLPPEMHTPTDITNDDADYEPTSTVTIKTPPETFKDEQEDNVPDVQSDYVWEGQIIFADVAKFHGKALLASGNAYNLKADVKEKLSVVGRISYDLVWEYMARMKASVTKEIIVIQIVPGSDDDEDSFSTLWSYLFKRSRIGVIGKTVEAIKDFYLYPLKASEVLPELLEPLSKPLIIDSSERILLGVIIKYVVSSRTSVPLTPSLPPAATRPQHASDAVDPPELSKTPPLPSSPEGKKDPRLKRKVRVQIAVEPAPAEDDDSPYSPASSDEDLPPLSKMPKKSVPLPPIPTVNAPNTHSDAAQIQKKIEEMNRAIEEHTQQIQSMVSTGPLLSGFQDIAPPPLVSPELNNYPQSADSSAKLPVPPVSALDLATNIAAVLPGLQALSSVLPTPKSPQVDVVNKPSVVTSSSDSNRSITPVPGEEQLELETPMEIDEEPTQTPMELDIPIPPEPQTKTVEEQDDEPYSPSAPPSPPPISLPGVSQISLPSNLQEILAAIKQKDPTTSPISPEPLPTCPDDKLESPPSHKKDTSSVFEKEGIPSFEASSKGKPLFKFEMKLKTQDLDEIAAPPAPAIADIDERTILLPEDRVSLKDHDERIVPPSRDRDERTSHRSRNSKRDRDDRYSSRSRDRGSRRYSDKDDRYRHKKDSKPRNRIEDEWEGSIRDYEGDLRRRARTIRAKEIDRLRHRDSD